MINRSQDEIIVDWPSDWTTPIVSIRCVTYNHEQYIADALDGFLIQKTSFPFEVIVHDDASTDKTADIIREYERKFPDIVKPIYETENQYSKHDGSLRNIMNKACKGKYYALCEGDDYWTDPNKLQMQVDWLEEHDDYVMCCSNATIQSSNHSLSGARYWNDYDVPIIDMICGRSCFLQTSTFIYRRNLLNFYPDYCIKCHVGDYPLQIWASLNGKVRYFKKNTSTYRYCHPGSFTYSSYRIDIDSFVKGIKSEVTMLQGLDSFSNFRHHSTFKKVETAFVLQKAFFFTVSKQRKDLAKKILSCFPEIFNSFSIYQKMDMFIYFHTPLFIYRAKRILDQILKALTMPNTRNLFDFYQKIQETLLSSNR